MDETEAEILNIYPVPTSVILNIELDFTQSTKVPRSLVIRNALGQIIEQVVINSTQQFLSLNTSNWAAGMYTAQLMGDSGSLKTEKIEIIH